MTEKESKYYERIKSELIGQKICEVYYEEVNWETDESEFWEFSTDIHSVDMNVIFRLENGKLIQIFWDNEFYSYDVGFTIIDKLEKKKEGFKTFNVSENKNWKKLIGEKISGIRVLWDISEGITTEYENDRIVKSENTVIKLPQTWEFSFGKNKIWIATLEIKEDESDNYYWADHLTIIFSNEVQEKYKLSENTGSQYYI
ncbi:hypothetical protein [Tenacibaculum sp. M341]|nr:hypothetical protein [Tenacibaculum sp. M341]TCI93798.1 hypothetical protein EYW44_05115 [Tenacibaculum sp. M341]